MSDAAQQQGAQQFAIATAFTCRSVIKYNSSLSEEEKKELLADIDTMVSFLRDRSFAHPAMEARIAPTQRQQAGARPSNANANADKAADKFGEAENKKYKQQLSEVYRITQLYLSKKNGDGTSEFMARFQQAMVSIDEMQVMATGLKGVALDKSGPYANAKHMEELLEDVRGCMADVYAIFIEFARAICNALQGSGICIDTEEMSSLHPERCIGQAKQKQGVRDITPLLQVYETHVQFNEKKGMIAGHIEDATALLMFLGENLGSYDGHTCPPDRVPQGPTLHIPTTLAPTDKRDTVIAQLNKVARLLNDLSDLLSNYESTMSALLKQEFDDPDLLRQSGSSNLAFD